MASIFCAKLGSVASSYVGGEDEEAAGADDSSNILVLICKHVTMVVSVYIRFEEPAGTDKSSNIQIINRYRDITDINLINK